MEDSRLILLRDCAVARPDGSVVRLTCLKPGSTLARINDQFIDPAARMLKAWAMDQAFVLPDLVIWPNICLMMETPLVRRVLDVSVAAIDTRLAGLLTTEEVISSWKVAESGLVHTSGPRRRVDHVIDLGDVHR